MENTKQILVIRKDLKMRRGKECAQAAHASMACLTKKGWPLEVEAKQLDEIQHWLKNSFRKITCLVESEEALLSLHESALRAGLVSHLIQDNGLTEFGGVPTYTCLAIGPHWDSRFAGITDSLKLY